MLPYDVITPPALDEALASVAETGSKGGYLFECPDFFELPVDGDPKDRRWILMGANTEYAVGTFDGVTFRPEHFQITGHRTSSTHPFA